jgi:hypothetical protein
MQMIPAVSYAEQRMPKSVFRSRITFYRFRVKKKFELDANYNLCKQHAFKLISDVFIIFYSGSLLFSF